MAEISLGLQADFAKPSQSAKSLVGTIATMMTLPQILWWQMFDSDKPMQVLHGHSPVRSSSKIHSVYGSKAHPERDSAVELLATH